MALCVLTHRLAAMNRVIRDVMLISTVGHLNTAEQLLGKVPSTSVISNLLQRAESVTQIWAAINASIVLTPTK